MSESSSGICEIDFLIWKPISEEILLRRLKPFYSPSDKTNKESVRAIQKSIFTVCLDAPMPRVSDELYQSRVAAQMLHGGGARWNSGNRWFDKTLQVRLRLQI